MFSRTHTSPAAVRTRLGPRAAWRLPAIVIALTVAVPILGDTRQASAVDHDATVYARGGADFSGSKRPDPRPRFVGMSGLAYGGGYWLATADGRVMARGNAKWHGSVADRDLPAPIAGIVATPSGKGYWLFAANGRVYHFGDARWRGGASHNPARGVIAAMASTPSGKGYWLLNLAGRVFAYGDAGLHGSLIDEPHSGYVVGIAPTRTGDGYWLTTTSGGVFSFGDAVFRGSLGSNPPAKPIIGMARTPSGNGYWLAGEDGHAYRFGDAARKGDAFPLPAARRVVAFAATTRGEPGYWFLAQPRPDSYVLLRPGSSGPRVTALQKRLRSLGYWVTVDGDYGSVTQQAVYAFQKYEVLSRSGVFTVGMNRRLTNAARPAARSTSGNLTELDVARQIILIVKEGRTQWVFNTSTGTETLYTFEGETSLAHTSRGRFRIQRQIDGLRISRLGQLWRPKYFDGGIAFHGSGSIPPYPASHGCSRLSYPAIDYVWAANLMPLGSEVWSY